MPHAQHMPSHIFTRLGLWNESVASNLDAAKSARRHHEIDEELYFAITVCALFNFYNRWIDATGVHRLSDEMHRAGGKRSAKGGYVR